MTPSGWLLLVTNLPGRKQALRMRVWRALKAAGAGMLRDGVYLLPTSEPARRLLDEKATEIQEGGGSAQVLPLVSEPTQQTAFEALFDRSAEYASAAAAHLGLPAFTAQDCGTRGSTPVEFAQAGYREPRRNRLLPK
jgi:hypothetical protein